MTLKPPLSTLALRPTVAIGPARADLMLTPYRPLRWFSADGLVLAGRTYGDIGEGSVPLLCLPGLTRSARDFEPVAAHLTRLGRQVIVADSRGRGLSEWDRDPTHYHPMIELADGLGLIDGLGLGAIDVLGTSRGGILTMLMATQRPTLIRRAIMNDIGPRIELAGLLKIKGYVSRDLGSIDWPTATLALSVSQKDQFPRLDAAGWERYARRLWRDVDGRPAADYDPALSLGMAGLTADTVLPEMWEAFATLSQRPVLVVRGALSDILSADTAREMAERHPMVQTVEVADEAHAPLLEDEPTLAAIADFLR